MQTITLTDEQYQQFKKDGAITIKIADIWKPKEGKYFTSMVDGITSFGNPPKAFVEWGLTRDKDRDAKCLWNETVTRNLISAWVDEHGGYQWTQGQHNYFIEATPLEWISRYTIDNHIPGVVYMDKHQADELMITIARNPKAFNIHHKV